VLFNLAFCWEPHEIWLRGLSRACFPQSYPQLLWIAEKQLMKRGVSAQVNVSLEVGGTHGAGNAVDIDS
jgi:hypothetical protein